MTAPRLYFSHESSTRKVGVVKTDCSNCGNPLEAHRIGKQRYCLPCHASFMRVTRPKHSELPDEARKKANVRGLAKYYQKKGEIEVKPCEVCGAAHAEKHHDDYSKPKDVRWLCRPHHLQWHRVNDGKILNENKNG